jgi:hypothetical protein
MSLLQLLKRNNKIIINTDLDGVLSGLILKQYAGCEIVGFSNSDNSVWINPAKINSIYDAVYIDMYVPDRDVVCIDQHIIGADASHNDVLRQNPNKINPNLMLGKFHDPMRSYMSKYPLGVLHFIIALLEKEGVEVSFDLKKIIAGNLTLGDLLLRADDAMHTTVATTFSDNANMWWDWLFHLSKKGRATTSFIEYLSSLKAGQAIAKKKETAVFLKSAPFYCESGDGGYKSILTKEGNLKIPLKFYVDMLAKTLEVKSFYFGQEYIQFKGQSTRITLSPNQKAELIKHNAINGQKVFSYAFIWGLNREGYFSYTVM